MRLITKMIMRENQTLTFDEVYALFQREFPHVRYIDKEYNLMYPLRCITYRGEKYLHFICINEEVICAEKETDKFYLIGDEIWLNDKHVFKLYNKPASNNELLRLIYGEAF